MTLKEEDHAEKALLQNTEPFDDEEFRLPRKAKRTWLRRNQASVFIHISILATYTLAFMWMLYHGRHCWHKDAQQGQASDSPDTKLEPNEPVSVVFNASPFLTSPYVGESRPSLDRAWHDLLQNTNLRISAQELKAINRTSIPLGVGGGFYGEMTVFHELHCLKFIRQAFHIDYYHDEFGDEERSKLGEHTEHCIEILRQSVMCRGDAALITFSWADSIKLPQPDFSQTHQCTDWDLLMDWAGDRAINVFEEGMLVHPTLGPSYPGGYREDRPLPKEDIV